MAMNWPTYVSASLRCCQLLRCIRQPICLIVSFHDGGLTLRALIAVNWLHLGECGSVASLLLVPQILLMSQLLVAPSPPLHLASFAALGWLSLDMHNLV